MRTRLHGLLLMIFLLTCFSFACSDKSHITLSCREDNDLFLTLTQNNIECYRYGTPDEAVSNAPEGSAVLVLADGYPDKVTMIDSLFFKKAADKRLRLYIEYPSYLPGVKTGTPRGTQWERAVISSDAFAPKISQHRILAVHDCHFIPMEAQNPDIVIARIAGFDSAGYGLPEKYFPLLFELQRGGEQRGILVSTTKLSQFLTARYAPADCWHAIWGHILEWLLPGKRLPGLEWTAVVRPGFTRDETLSDDYDK